MSSTQWRATTFSVIGLDYNAVIRLAEIYDIELTPMRFTMLRELERLELVRARKEADKKHGE